MADRAPGIFLPDILTVCSEVGIFTLLLVFLY